MVLLCLVKWYQLGFYLLARFESNIDRFTLCFKLFLMNFDVFLKSFFVLLFRYIWNNHLVGFTWELDPYILWTLSDSKAMASLAKHAITTDQHVIEESQRKLFGSWSIPIDHNTSKQSWNTSMLTQSLITNLEFVYWPIICPYNKKPTRPVQSKPVY